MPADEVLQQSFDKNQFPFPVSTLIFFCLQVNLVSEHIWCEDFLVRSFYLKNVQTNETRTVTQFHFLSWMDQNVPESARTLLDFRRCVKCGFRLWRKPGEETGISPS